MEKTYSFKDFSNGGKAEVIIKDNTLTIRRPGVLAKLSHGFTGDKTIMLNQISAVQIKKVGFARGYIQFVMAGREERKSGMAFGAKDENIIYIASYSKKVNDYHNQEMDEIKEYIENYNANMMRPIQVVQQVRETKSDFDKLKDLKELLDSGVLTQEEFDETKKKILNQL